MKAIYYIANAISFAGSMAMTVTIGPLLLAKGATLIEVGFIVAAMRVATVVIQTLFGHIPDVFGGAKVLAYSELGAFLCTLYVYNVVESTRDGWLLYFSVGMIARMCFTSISFSSTQKIAKTIAELEGSGGRIATTLSQISSGSMFVMGIVCFALYERLSLRSVMLFDAATFLLSGLIQITQIRRLSTPQAANVEQLKARYISLSISKYYSRFPSLAQVDLMISFVFCGSNALNIVLLEAYPSYIPLLPGLFGLGGVLAGFFSKHITRRRLTMPYWLIMAAAFGIYPLFFGNPEAILAISFIRNIAYWIIYHYVGQELMKMASGVDYAEVASGRQASSVLILAAGEPCVGAIHATLGSTFDLISRCVIAATGAAKLRKE